MRSIDDLLGEFHKITKEVPDEVRYKAMEVLFRAYEEHKEKYGSFSNLNGPEYMKLMRSRQDYQLNKVIEYVRLVDEIRRN